MTLANFLCWKRKLTVTLKGSLVYLTVILAVVSCASSPKIRDVTELAPPRNVLLDEAGGERRLTWQASPHEEASFFAGYNVYASHKSLMFAPVEDLPTPTILPKSQHELTLSGEPVTGGKQFVHVRSRSIAGDLSLPSLPEIVHNSKHGGH